MAQQLVDPYLDFESSVAVFLVDWEVGFRNERDYLVRSLRTEDVAKRDVLESFGLANIIVVWLL